MTAAALKRVQCTAMRNLREIGAAGYRRLRPRAEPEPAEPLFTIELEYPVDPVPRYGWGRPSHPQLASLLDSGAAHYNATLKSFNQFADPLARIPLESTSPTGAFWNNHWFQGLDIVALYSLLAQRDPGICLEIGAGFSTRIARRAIQDHGLRTRIVSIDPEPRSPVADIADEHIRSGLQDVDLQIFDTLGAGDMLLFDGSHRVLTNSDVTVLFTEVLPRLAAGVLVEVHDIFLPWDYRPDWSDRWYSEQYLLAGWLLGGSRLRVVLPSFYLSVQPGFDDRLAGIWGRFDAPEAINRGAPSSFWFEMSD